MEKKIQTQLIINADLWQRTSEKKAFLIRESSFGWDASQHHKLGLRYFYCANAELMLIRIQIA